MKKISLAVFIAAVAIGAIFSGGCGSDSVKNLGGATGSGNSKTEVRNVTGFTKIDAESAINVEITSQKDFAVTVEADDNLLSNVKTEVSGDTLKIYVEGDVTMKNRADVKISMPEIEALDISGASAAVVSGVEADSLDIRVSGASKIKIDGEAKEIIAEATGASKIDAENLKTGDAEVKASGASGATVSASGSLKAEASGASRISYTGDPKNLEQNASGASSISKK